MHGKHQQTDQKIKRMGMFMILNCLEKRIKYKERLKNYKNR
jgi:hypothetical protein